MVEFCVPDMNTFSKEIMEVLVAFEALPKSYKKIALAHRYLSDEISVYEFADLAREFIKQYENPPFLN